MISLILLMTKTTVRLFVTSRSKDKLGEEALVKISRVEFSPVAVHNCT